MEEASAGDDNAYAALASIVQDELFRFSIVQRRWYLLIFVTLGPILATGVTLVMFELVVRPTPLVYVFGPASPRRH